MNLDASLEVYEVSFETSKPSSHRAIQTRPQRQGMNRFDRLFSTRGEARVKFGDGDFKVLVTGDFVRCAMSGEPIALADLRYWNVERQEAYASAALSLQRTLELRAREMAGDNSNERN